MPASDTKTSKLSCIVDDEEAPFTHPRTYRAPDADDPSPRVVTAAPDGDPSIFGALVACLRPPYGLLYVLHTPRGEAAPGRYESPPIDAGTLEGLLRRFGDYLRADARFDLWAYSFEDRATVVWDRHDLLYAYGPIDRYIGTLDALGFVVGEPGVAFPHAHHYRPEFDADARALLDLFEWHRSELRPGDEQ